MPEGEKIKRVYPTVEGLQSSAAAPQLVEDDFAFPDSVKGMRILEVGTGLSTMVLKLNSMGAFAVGVDYRFQSGNLALAAASNDLHIGHIKKTEKGEIVREFVKLNDRTRAGFLDAARKRNKPYVGALAQELPFGDGVFDLVFSYNCIGDMVIDPDAFMGAGKEALRVTRGEVQIAPWFMVAQRGKEMRQRTRDAFIKYLSEAGYQYSFTHSGRSTGSGLLRIFKP